MNKETQAAKILKLLKSTMWVSNITLNDICYRYSARIHELRKEGYDIQREYVKPGVFRYWLNVKEQA